MFHNIGTRIKRMAAFLGWLGCLGSIALGVLKILASRQLGRWELSVEMAVVGWLTILLGIILSRVISVLIYGFGDLVENADFIRRYLERKSSYTASRSSLGTYRTTPYAPEEQSAGK